MKYQLLLPGGLVFLILTILFVGEFYDPEDGDRSFFIKYKPTLQHVFYSPVAQHRYMPAAITPAELKDESAYQDFVAKRISLKSGAIFPLLPALLIQVTLTLLVCGIFQFITKRRIKDWQLIFQFLINVFITTFSLVYITHYDNAITTLIIALLLTTINLITIRLLTKPNRLQIIS